MINIIRKISDKTKSRIIICMLVLISLVVGIIQFRTMRLLYDMRFAYHQTEDIQNNPKLNGSDAIDDIKNSEGISIENDASNTRDSVHAQIMRDTRDIINRLNIINRHLENKKNTHDMDTDTLKVGT